MAEEAPKTTPLTDKFDKVKMAESAENALEAAKTKGKLDDKSGVGQYVNKAQDYLHQMHSGDAGKEEKEKTDKDKKEKQEIDKDKEEKEETGGGGAGGIMKMAQGLFK